MSFVLQIELKFGQSSENVTLFLMILLGKEDGDEDGCAQNSVLKKTLQGPKVGLIAHQTPHLSSYLSSEIAINGDLPS